MDYDMMLAVVSDRVASRRKVAMTWAVDGGWRSARVSVRSVWHHGSPASCVVTIIATDPDWTTVRETVAVRLTDIVSIG